MEEYYNNLSVSYPKEILLKEYDRIQTTTPNYMSLPHQNKLVIHFQFKEFFKNELELWNNYEIRSKLFENREKFLGKGFGELSALEVLRGLKASGLSRKSFSHFNQQWFRAFLEEYKVTSVYDPCGGWGHRLTACPKDFLYIYNDINPTVVKNCEKISKFLNMSNKIFCNKDCSKEAPDTHVDAIFTCPPYWRTEWYSEKGAENLSYSMFLEWWRQTILQSLKCKPRLIAFVISDKFKLDMIMITEDCGIKLIKEQELGTKDSHFHKKTRRNKEVMVVFNCK